MVMWVFFRMAIGVTLQFVDFFGRASSFGSIVIVGFDIVSHVCMSPCHFYLSDASMAMMVT
ncbi:hypothetical protein HanRHA438_Chr11g0480871 [Helianthus annuus]|uniref:Uncharacterized protein n=1 Tax=Helianthus annuus TaxID=4232 RepID=A0A9K3GWY2_HELAN|nr:hypothetical protein HanXRQr2_Chr17g0824211 [Helianthus annuus]KAJ0449074.1 hypothetical protein HanHA89_Chr17g0724231 [Helianthus annuus]KAJ0499880.1 hypothetical protein HanHA300_Chr11g0383581 [Helianthus annuus]KAJ0507170.1 hypothetical protein HanIR_Chr11g0503381 [Helianthus annuus]KAJ0515728.1 hypothetical protein HanHA89_Chr11g0406071 [Helianthus annuus]